MGRSTRRWGWHQLAPDQARRLVAEAQLPSRSLVIDIGAGHGAITEPLLRAGHRVIAVEAHPQRAAFLERRFGADITLVRADASDLRMPRRPFHVVANPPYAITSPLLRRLLQRGGRLQTGHLVVQEHAAQRWVAGAAPGAGRWMREYELTIGWRIPRRAFDPPPAVPSVVLRIRRRG